MKDPIEWTALVELLKGYGFRDDEIEPPWGSLMVASLSTEARTRYGGQQSGTIIMEPKRVKVHRGKKATGFWGRSSEERTTTTETIWDLAYTPDLATP